MLTNADLPQIVELLSVGFAVGVGGGLSAYILTLLINLFYGIADG